MICYWTLQCIIGFHKMRVISSTAEQHWDSVPLSLLSLWEQLLKKIENNIDQGVLSTSKKYGGTGIKTTIQHRLKLCVQPTYLLSDFFLYIYLTISPVKLHHVCGCLSLLHITGSCSDSNTSISTRQASHWIFLIYILFINWTYPMFTLTCV